MHVESALISTAVACAAFASQAGATGYSLKKSLHEMTDKNPILAGTAGALVFAGQMMNVTIPAVGSSGHIVGGIFLSFLLGPHIAFGVMALILTLQCLMFGDGGLLALGCNILNMGFISCYVAYPLIAKPIADKLGGKKGMAVGSVVGCAVGLEIGALFVCLETLVSGISQLPFTEFAAKMLPIHLVVGLGEGIITAAALCLINAFSKGDFFSRRALGVIMAAALITGGCLCNFASEYPDGLEWSIGNVCGAETVDELPADETHIICDNIQASLSVMSDYSIATANDALNSLGTSVSGISGCMIIFTAFAVVYILTQKKLKGVR